LFSFIININNKGSKINRIYWS